MKFIPLKNQLILVFILLTSSLSAQINFSELSIEMGIVKNNEEFYPIEKKNEFSFYPKLSIGGELALAVFRWKVFLSYWKLNEMWEKNYGWKYSSYNIGLMIQMLVDNPTNFENFGIRINYGLSLHYYTNKPIRPENYQWQKEKSYSQIWYFDFGLEFNYNISSLFTPYISFEYHQHLSNSLTPYFQPWSLALGLSYKI